MAEQKSSASKGKLEKLVEDYIVYQPTMTTTTNGIDYSFDKLGSTTTSSFTLTFTPKNPFEEAEAKVDVIKKQIEEAVKNVTTGSMITQIRKVIPMELENKIHDLRERESKLSWDYGNVANEIYQYMVANNLPYTRLEACGYLAAQIDNFRAPNTILRYAMVAEFFSNKKAWERYDFLPFSHFELAMRMGDRWQEVLDKSVELMAGQFGRPPSRARLEMIFENRLADKQMERSVPSFEAVSPNGAVIGPVYDQTDEVRNLLAQLQTRLPIVQVRHPEAAPLIAQALLLLEQAMNKIP